MHSNLLHSDDVDYYYRRAAAELARLGLDEHLSAQRSNGVRAMVARIRESAAAA